MLYSLRDRVAEMEPARHRQTATPILKPEKRLQALSSERPSKRTSVKRARRVHANRNAVESDSDSDDEEEGAVENGEVEESGYSSTNSRGTRRKSRPPRRFIDIQESLVSGKAHISQKGTLPKPKTGNPKQERVDVTGLATLENSPSRGMRRSKRKIHEESCVDDVEIFKR